MNDDGGVWIAFEPDFEGIKIKRGTRLKEFLYKLFLIESFLLSKSKFGQYDANSARTMPRRFTKLKLQE